MAWVVQLGRNTYIHTYIRTDRQTDRQADRHRYMQTDAYRDRQSVCVECLIGKQNKPILFKVTEPSSIPYRTHSACAKMAAYPDPPPVIPVPESIAAQAAYQLRYKNTEYCSWVSSGPKCFQVLVTVSKLFRVSVWRLVQPSSCVLMSRSK